jgi:hypothetical protein
MGIQLVGLTFKNLNEENYFVQSLFLENGGARCGYLQKPVWMCHQNPKNLYAKDFDQPLFMLSVKVLSGHNCIINDLQQEKGVFVEVSLRGNRKEEESNKKAVSGGQEPGYYMQFGL